MKRTIQSPTCFSPVEKEKRTTSPTIHRTSSHSSLISTSSSVRSLDRNLLHGLDISFKGHPVMTYRLREQINVDTTFESENFVFERDSGSGSSILRGKIRGRRIQGQSNENNQLPMTRWVKLENCQWAFGEEKL
jgi:hypothetical protein